MWYQKLGASVLWKIDPESKTIMYESLIAINNWRIHKTGQKMCNPRSKGNYVLKIHFKIQNSTIYSYLIFQIQYIRISPNS